MTKDLIKTLSELHKSGTCIYFVNSDDNAHPLSERDLSEDCDIFHVSHILFDGTIRLQNKTEAFSVNAKDVHPERFVILTTVFNNQK